MSMTDKIVVFDFDKTLTCKDTVLGFFMNCGRKSRLFPFKLAIYFLLMTLARLNIISNFRLKDLGIKIFMKNLDMDKIEAIARKYSEHIRTRLLNKIYTDEYQKYNGSYIVSASFYEYLKYLFPKERIIASMIDYQNGKPMGLLFNSYKGNKISKLRELNINSIDILYTDGKSDFSLVGNSKTVFWVKGDKVMERDKAGL